MTKHFETDGPGYVGDTEAAPGQPEALQGLQSLIETNRLYREKIQALEAFRETLVRQKRSPHCRGKDQKAYYAEVISKVDAELFAVRLGYLPVLGTVVDVTGQLLQAHLDANTSRIIKPEGPTIEVPEPKLGGPGDLVALYDVKRD